MTTGKNIAAVVTPCIVNMKESPTMLMKTKGREKRMLGYPTMLMKIKPLILVIPRC